VLDNGTNFALHDLQTGMLIRTFSAGTPIKRFPKQVIFAEDDTVIVGGSDHGAVYVFDRKMGVILDTMAHSKRGLVQTITVSVFFRIVSGH
jgi:hypothetical protein